MDSKIWIEKVMKSYLIIYFIQFQQITELEKQILRSLFHKTHCLMNAFSCQDAKI